MSTPVTDFDYPLPERLIAQYPAEPRDSSRLLVLDQKTGEMHHKLFRDIVDELHTGDVLVFNATKVFRARLINSEGVEMFVLRIGKGSADVLLRPGKKFPVGSAVAFGGIRHPESSDGFRVGARNDEEANFIIKEKTADGVVRVDTGMSASEMFAFCEKHGEIPTPPYVTSHDIQDAQYQTVYAKETGSVAAPTAGLHFTAELLDRLRAKGVQCEEVILHVGIGTFRPVQVTHIEDHVMHSERVELKADTAERIMQAKREGRRIIAVGTTTTRVLEGVARSANATDACHLLVPFSGELNLFITPGFHFRIIDGLITNFHLPKSTLLMLVSAFAGRDRVLSAYNEAIAREYRFFSFGDAMFIR